MKGRCDAPSKHRTPIDARPTGGRYLSGVVSLLVCLPAFAQSPGSVGEFWPTLSMHSQLQSGLRLLGETGLQKGADYPYQQVFASVGLGYQILRFRQPHEINIDPDKEHRILVGAGYEYLRTIQSGVTRYENRLAIEAVPRHRFGKNWLISDRNRIEFRWVNDRYSTRYRNQFTLERDVRVHGFKFIPYASAEVYYDGGKASWNEEQYTGGLQWPHKRRLMLETYYLRQHCTTCTPKYLDVAGVTLNLYFRNEQ